MSDAALRTAMSITIPTFAVLVGILINNSRLNDLRSYMDWRFDEVNRRLESMERRWDEKFEDLKSVWRSELLRVEGVIDARLKHLEEERH